MEDLYLTFAKKASAFNSWFENAEEDLTDPVRCNSVEEIMVSASEEKEELLLFNLVLLLVGWTRVMLLFILLSVLFVFFMVFV